MFGTDTSQTLWWLALAVPLLATAQVGLLKVRDRLRARIHSTPSVEPDLESAVRDSLFEVFDEAATNFDESLEGPSFRAHLIALTSEVADRTEARVTLSRSEQDVLRAALVDAVLEAFNLDEATR